ncbi:MAG: tRNA uridine-5-carboxymethylaminomethyl(34) synthesis GTPase MnmE [bacterium]|jgi:tRNA modification GTPase
MSDTIAAIATAVGPGAISAVRLSGPDALAISDRVFRGRERPSESNHKSLLIGEIAGRDGQVIDQVLLLIMRSPNSYTGDDLVEITCHGGLVAPRLVLRGLVEEGARPADPGEFTKRAFLNGKMDLAQAEAVSELVQAKSEKALRAAVKHLKGELSYRIHEVEASLLDHLALIEANIDFPEDEIDGIDRPALGRELGGISSGLESLLSTHSRGRFLKDGIDAAIVGKPNVGKSSLFNSLVGEERVIVSEMPGTTRDVVDAAVPVDGLLLNIHDTAGVLEARDSVEVAAVERTRAALEESDIVLVVVDASSPLDEADADILGRSCGKRRMIVFNKIDLEDMEEHFGEDHEIRVSALKGWGIQGLLERLRYVSEDMVGDLADDMVTSERHALCLGEALEAVQRAGKTALEGAPIELIASDLRTALLSLGKITGSNASENLLDEIFSRFCIGK